MHVDTHQQDLLGTTLDSLLRYVNQRHHVVRDIDPDDEDERHVGLHLVSRFLWRHRELIEEFVRENPDRLSASHLAIASGFADAIYGTFFLEGSHEGQMATLAHAAGVYTVWHPSELPASLPCDAPLEVRGAIAPFLGRIVSIPPLVVMGEAPDSLLRQLHEDLDRHGLARPITSARDFVGRADLWNREQERTRAEEDARRAQAASPLVGVGFHRGALAGLSGDERREARIAHRDLEARRTGSYRISLDARSLEADDFPVTLEDGLRLLDDDWIADIAHGLDGEIDTERLSRKELVRLVCHRMPRDRTQRDLSLLWCTDEQIELVRRLMHTNPLPLDDLPASVVDNLYPMIPYVFILSDGGRHVAWMPPEIRTLVSWANLADYLDARRQLDTIRACASTLATICGIISVDDVYGRYRRLAGSPLDREQFDLALAELETCDSRDGYALWTHRGTDYVISVELSDVSAAARVARESYPDHIVDAGAPSGRHAPTLVRLSVEDEGEFARLMARRQEQLRQARIDLLASRDDLPPHDIPQGVLSSRPIDALVETRALSQLRAFVDHHVPDDQDEYEFPDTFARAVAVSSVLMEEPYNETMGLIGLFGMERCEGTDFSDTLGRLVTNAYNALPRWQLNGWSLEENTERMTGRRQFFNDDGTAREVADDEDCPCGSGRPYGRCCGNLA